MLMNARKKAIKKKFLQYVIDPKYRRSYRNRIYYNVNQDVPSDDNLYMDADMSLSEIKEYSQNYSNYFNTRSLISTPYAVDDSTTSPNIEESKDGTSFFDLDHELCDITPYHPVLPQPSSTHLTGHRIAHRTPPTRNSSQHTSRIHRTPSFKTKPHRRLLVIYTHSDWQTI